VPPDGAWLDELDELDALGALGALGLDKGLAAVRPGEGEALAAAVRRLRLLL
jgi:hypothetical protein